MIKYILSTIVIFLFLAGTIYAQDTTWVSAHDNTQMVWYENYDNWSVFPPDTTTYRKVYMHYDMGCASGGCSPWDYTTKVEVRHRTGALDSNLVDQATFVVNGSVLDSIHFNLDTTYTYFFDSINLVTDSITNDSIAILVYGDSTLGNQPTDTLTVFPSNYWNYIYNSSGVIIDSTLVSADSSWYVDYYGYYTVFDEIETYELARVITPYGGNLPNNWSFKHVFDVTDFEDMLHDSVEIRVRYEGWSAGFSATLDFEFIEGTPIRDVVKIENLYRGSWGYANSADFENNYLYQKRKYIEPTTSEASIKMTTTGHGFDNNNNSAEFLPINYFVKVDGTTRYTQLNWRDDCGENPLYPDYEVGGAYSHTWIYDRANWCPGLQAWRYEHEITDFITPGDSSDLDVNFQSYTWSGTQQPSYIIDCHLVQYGSANFNRDMEVIDVIQPSSKDVHSRLNPVCVNPKIVVRNSGASTVTSFTVNYLVQGSNTETYTWSGALNYLDTIHLRLPITSQIFWSTSESVKVFEASITDVNGQGADEYADNNSYQSTFELVPDYPSDMYVWFRPNNAPNETSYKILDDAGNIITQSGSVQAGVYYNDTIYLQPGCYKMIVEDTQEDGLYFPYNNDGNGILRLRQLGGGTVYEFKTNFGTNYIHEFRVLDPNDINTQELQKDVFVYPNPSNQSFNVDIQGYRTDVRVTIYDQLGKNILSEDIPSNGNLIRYQVDLSNCSSGVYVMRIQSGNDLTIRKLIKE